uniref:Peptidase S26 domain-containing protein n=1 Tax=Fibrocapsa japonica TaxID=94617 RepID=A0A7S2XZ43_9STRA|mmetsp:Transcript_487/g.708  ORF Transcript_487/g.708 Transcript_487/m.708 type:complete len:245 (+) Transcript_487:69-803(+)
MKEMIRFMSGCSIRTYRSIFFGKIIVPHAGIARVNLLQRRALSDTANKEGKGVLSNAFQSWWEKKINYVENHSWEFYKSILKFIMMMYCTTEYVIDITTCVGPSMEPTMDTNGEVVLQEKLSAWLFQSLQIGDVVISTSPSNLNVTVCKRIRAMPGDLVMPVKRGGRHFSRWQQVPEGHVWLQGDNPQNSTDSRDYGPVPLGLIKGRVFAKVYPFWKAGFIGRDHPEERKGPALYRQERYIKEQ